MRKLIVLILLSLSGNCFASAVAQWKMNDNASDAVVTDSVGSNNGTFGDSTGDPNTDAHTTTGKINGALTFDGTDDKITVSADSSIDAKDKTTLTIATWIYPTSSGRIVDKHDSSGKGYKFYVSGGGITLIALIEHDSTAAQAIKTNIVTVGAWNHAVLVYNEDGAKKIKLYLDGVLQSLTSDTAGVGTISDDSSEELRIGTDESDGNNFTGKIDNVIIYDEALTLSEVRVLYNGGRGTENASIGGNRRSRYSNWYRVKYRNRYNQ